MNTYISKLLFTMDLIFCLYVLLVLLLTLSAVVVGASVYFKYFDADGVLMAKIPSQRGVPIFHNAFDCLLDKEQLFQYARDLYKEFKGIYGLSGFNYRYVNVFEPEDIEKILSSSTFNTKRFPYTFLQPWLGSGLLISNGDKWQERRKMLTPAFHFNILKKFQKNFNEQVENLLEVLQKEVGKEKTEIFPVIAKSTLQIICETSMGSSMLEDIRDVTNKYFNSIHVLGECIVYRMFRLWFYPESTFRLTKKSRIQKAALNDLHKFTKQIIRERREFRKDHPITKWNDEVYGKKNRMAMLDMLLEQEKLGKIDEDGIREEVDTFLFEGYDTTATTLCFMIMRIANEPVAQNLIYEELQRVLGDKQRPTMEDCNEMKYLECCIKESLRLYPSVPYISRVINENVELSGYTIPKSTELSLLIFDIHRQEHIYPEPEKFVPERFLPENAAKRHPYAYIPFSAGPRNCIGQKYAMLEVKTVMAAIIRRFRLEPVTRPEDIIFVTDLVLRASNPIYVRFIDRKKDVDS